MARHESNALDARLSGQGEHLGEPRPSVEKVPAIRVDVLPEQRDLANALGEARRVSAAMLSIPGVTSPVRARTGRCSSCRSYRIRS